MWLMKRYRISARHFRQNRHFPKGPFAISLNFCLLSSVILAINCYFCHFRQCIFVYDLSISAINRHFRHFRQIRHFRQYRHFPKGPFAIVFEFLFTVWRVWRLIAISAIFAKYAIFAEIATFQRAPLPSHLNFCLQFGDFGD